MTWSLLYLDGVSMTISKLIGTFMLFPTIALYMYTVYHRLGHLEKDPNTLLQSRCASRESILIHYHHRGGPVGLLVKTSLSSGIGQQMGSERFPAELIHQPKFELEGEHFLPLSLLSSPSSRVSNADTTGEGTAQ